MRRVLLAITCALLAAPAAASAQLFVFGLPSGSATHLKFKSLAVRAVGQVSVSFHSDAGTGCAVLGACAYSGTITWIPNGGGILELTQYEQRHRPHVYAFLGVGDNNPGSLTASTVRRSSGGECADEEPGIGVLPAAERGANQRFTLTGALMPTRCAGPVAADLAAAIPRVTISSRRLEAGHVRLDFRGRRSFASHGFAGTLTSSLVVTVGGPVHMRLPIPTQPPATKPVLIRVVTETLHARVGGRLSDAISGSSDPDVCVLLDSCGLSGTLTLTPKATVPKAELTASGPASRPYRDFLTALGLSRAGRAGGISVSGEIEWKDAGTVSEAIHQAAACTDTAPLADGLVGMVVTGTRIAAQYGLGLGFGSAGTERTRCPGPSSIGVNGPLVSGSVPRSRLRRRAFTITLHRSAPASDEGYTVRPAGAITLELRRGRVHQTVESLPTLGF